MRYRSLFSHAGITPISRPLLDRINADLRTVELPEIDNPEEVPLAHLKIDYPHKSRLASLKHTAVPRSDVGAHWVSVDAVAEHFNYSKAAIVKSGDLILTSVRLIVAWSPEHQPTVPEKPQNGERFSILMLLLRDIDEARFEFPVMGLHFIKGYPSIAGIGVRVSVAYPGASLLSAVSGIGLPGESVEAKLTAAEMRDYNRSLEAKGNATEAALSEFFVDVVNRNLSHGLSIREV